MGGIVFLFYAQKTPCGARPELLQFKPEVPDCRHPR